MDTVVTLWRVLKRTCSKFFGLVFFAVGLFWIQKFKTILHIPRHDWCFRLKDVVVKSNLCFTHHQHTFDRVPMLHTAYCIVAPT